MTVKARDRKAVYARDHETCIVSGFPTLRMAFEPCSGPLTVQHTVGKGMGGSSLYDTPDLLLAMCNTHNGLLTSDAEFARIGRVKGWVKDRNAKRDPRLQPVSYSDGWFRLIGDSRVQIPDADAIEYLQVIGVLEAIR